MCSLHAIHLTTVDQLRAAAADWDDLWWRSETALAVTRAETLCQWIEHFHPRSGLHVLAVADEKQWLAALPLVACRVGGLIPAGGLPCNPWSPCGELLLDAAADADAVLDALLAAANELPWQLLWLNEAMPEAPRWQGLLRACNRAGIAATCHERWRIGRVMIGGDWDLYLKRLPKSHRQGVIRAAKRLACEGDVQYEMNSHLDPAEVEPWLRSAFELENCGWKGEAGTSVLRAPGVFPFFIRQAQQLARWGQLETAALRLDGRLLAFIYGYRAKGVYFSHKISYDARLAAFSPGRLLFCHVLEQLHRDSSARAMDFMGPMNQSLSRWRPQTYAVGRVVLAPRGLPGRAAMYAYKHWWRRLRDGAPKPYPHDPQGTPAGDDGNGRESGQDGEA